MEDHYVSLPALAGAMHFQSGTGLAKKRRQSLKSTTQEPQHTSGAQTGKLKMTGGLGPCVLTFLRHRTAQNGSVTAVLVCL